VAQGDKAEVEFYGGLHSQRNWDRSRFHIGYESVATTMNRVLPNNPKKDWGFDADDVLKLLETGTPPPPSPHPRQPPPSLLSKLARHLAMQHLQIFHRVVHWSKSCYTPNTLVFVHRSLSQIPKQNGDLVWKMFNKYLIEVMCHHLLHLPIKLEM